MEIGRTRFVEFYRYCKKCKHSDRSEHKPPCSECISEPVREYSHRPAKYEEDPAKVKEADND